jgi:chromosome segregation ATPase
MKRPPIRPLGMATSTLARFRTQDSWTRLQHCRREAATIPDFSFASPWGGCFSWQLLAIVAAMTGLGMLSWKLHQANEEESRLRRTVGNLSTLARASIQDLAHTKRRLIYATDDKRLLQRVLTVSGRTEQELTQGNNAMLSEISRLRNRASLAEGQNSNLALNKAHLQSENDQMRNEIAGLRSTICGQESTIRFLESRLCCLQRDLATVRCHR